MELERFRSKKLREYRYRERYSRSLQGKRVGGDGDNVEHICEQVIRQWLKAQESVWLGESGEKEPKECLVER